MRGAVKWSTTAVLLFALLGTGFILLRKGSQPNLEEVKVREPVPVTALRIEERSFVLEGEYSARLSAVRDVVVTAKAGGTVEEDFISEGDRVGEGQALYRLDDDAYRFNLQQAEAALDLARENLRKVQNVSRPELLRRLEALVEEREAALKKAESDAARFAELLAEGAIPLSQKENIDLALAAARSRAKVARENLGEARRGAREEDRAVAAANLKQAEAALLLARDTLENATITSPLKGIVASKEVFAGDTVRTGTPVAEVVDISSFKIRLGVSPADVLYFHRGDDLDVIPLPSGESLPAEVADVGVKADEKTGSFPVILRADNPGGRGPVLRAGMDVQVRFVKARADDAVVVPASALLRNREGTAVFIVESKEARRRRVVLGASSEKEAVIASGLDVGELIIVVGQQRLRDGDPVELTIEE
jgi:multidrug efflux pump subunit AcrA (membrane-fusion protein)